MKSCTFVSTGLTRRKFVQTLIAGSTLVFAPNIWARQKLPTHAEGFVFHDRDSSGTRQGNHGIAGVAVSNGREICVTDRTGRWRLPIEDEQTTFFVNKPRDWMTPLSKDNLPRAYYIHQPEGSPRQRFSGVRPTGPLPDSIDFPLTQRPEPERFKALMCGDPQPRNGTEVGYLARTVVPHLTGTDALFGVSLGDIMFDNLSLFDSLNEAMGLIGIPWHNVVGNHDLNFDAADNRHATESFRSVYGPTYYAFDYGPVHFLVLNNIHWMGRDPERKGGNYRAGLGARQLEFIKNDLKLVPNERLTVLLFHIPPRRGADATRMDPAMADWHKLYRLLEDRPHTLSFSAHTHSHNHLFLGRDEGWRGAHPHHHVNTGTLCGSWFGGAPDERGVPFGIMADGTPRGYLEVEFDGNRYNIDGYRVLQRPRSHQMNLHLPAELSRAEIGATPLYANVFNGSTRSRVRMRCGAGEQWRELTKVDEHDPGFLRERQREVQAPFRPLPMPLACSHLWRGILPANLPVGTHRIEVLATDMFGNDHRDLQPVRIVG